MSPMAFSLTRPLSTLACTAREPHGGSDDVPHDGGCCSERCGPARFVSVGKDAIGGNLDLDSAGTSHVELRNGSLRQWCKRLTPGSPTRFPNHGTISAPR